MKWWRRRSECPDSHELSRAFSTAGGSLPGHVAACPACRREWDALVRLRRVALTPVTPLAEPAVDRIRAALLTRPPPAERAHRWRWIGVTAAACLPAIVVVLALAGRHDAVHQARSIPALPAPVGPSRAAQRGEVQAVGVATFARVRRLPDEAVELRQGRIHVEVQPLAAGERFRVLTRDGGEVEVRGTAFDVTADHDRLAGVHVFHGRVEARPATGRGVLLSAGETWAPPADAPAAIRPARPRVARPRLATAPAPVPIEDAADRHFRLGWERLASGDPGAAAPELAAAAASAPPGGMAEDARFWRAVALLRAHQSAPARLALEEYLQRHPTAPRASEASVMLGWLLLDAGDVASARTRFEAARADSVPEVRRSAAAGLAATQRSDQSGKR